MKYSLIIPLKNEEDNVIPLIEEITHVMQSLGEVWEVICVNDGSSDQTHERLELIKKQTSCLHIISFEKNFGQSSAFKAGFEAAKGEILISLDGDGQNDPNDIPKLLEELNHHDMVVGWRKDRIDPWFKKISSKTAKVVRQKVCKDSFPDINCSLKVFRKDIYNKIKLYQGMHRFLPLLFEIEGARVKQIPVNHRPRIRGKSNYHLFNRFLSPIIDMLAVRWMRKRAIHYKIKEQI
jgi:dolichol-phosphate mannosyltransferase